MNGKPSLSVFTIEVDRKPVFAIQCRKHSEAESILADESLRGQMRLVKSDGKPLCDDFSIFRVRLASQNEKALFYENAISLLVSNGQLAVLLVKLDDS